MIFSPEVQQALKKVYQDIADVGQRALILIEGCDEWTLSAIQEVLELFVTDSVLWYSERAPEGSWQLPADKINHELGREASHGVFDLYSGFQPDALAAIAGSIRSGGFLFVLGPPLDQWPTFQDPLAHRIAVEPWGAMAVKRDFIRRGAWILASSPKKIRLRQGEGQLDGFVINEVAMKPKFADEWGCITTCQRRAVEAVLHVVDGHRKRPLVIEADRGRGKSAAMGIAVARLLAMGKRIIVTAPRPDNVETLFRFGNQGDKSNSNLQFFAPDRLLEMNPSADMLLVDEAAAIAPELLKSMLGVYSRVVLATTVNGYEGTGRGFAIRFQQYLEHQYAGWVKCTLDQPVRWQAGDWLEECLDRLLLLKPDPQSNKPMLQGELLEFNEFIYQCDDRSERILNSLFELLVSAHYRTRPSDLRTLLDGSNVRLFILNYDESIKAVAMVAQEGELAGSLAECILEGKRRPHGQVLPQTLAVHLGQDVALTQRHWRVVRIAVQPEEQNRGLGRDLLQRLVETAREEGMDTIGSLFSGNHKVLNFWQGNGFSVSRVGYTRESTTGSHSLLLLKGLSNDGQHVVDQSLQRFYADFPLMLLSTHRQLPADLVLQIMSAAKVGVDPLKLGIHERDQRSLYQYLAGYTPYENVAPSLWRLIWSLKSPPTAKEQNNGLSSTIVVMKVLQNASWDDCVARLSLAGIKQARSLLRESIKEWML